MILACGICRAFSWRRALCSTCAQVLHHRIEPFARLEGSFPTYSVFTWRRDGWRGLNWWLYALKNKEASPFWREPAVWALDVFGPPKDAVLVPVPSRHRHNHARGFARELGRWSGCPVIEALETVGRADAAQKRLSRSRRRSRRFRSSSVKIKPGLSVILVDDVITSGATAEAAYRALNKPARFRVWCLADRRPVDSPVLC